MFSERAVNKSFTSKNSIYQENEAWKFSSEPLDGARPKAGGLADTAWHNQQRSLSSTSHTSRLLKVSTREKWT